MSKEYTEQLLIDFGKDGENLIPVVTQDHSTKEVLLNTFFMGTTIFSFYLLLLIKQLSRKR